MTDQDQNQTFSQEIIKNSNKTVTVIDDLGRSIVLRKPKFSHYLNLLKALGAELSKNTAYVENIGIVSAIVSIDGQPQVIKSLVDAEHIIRVLDQSDDALVKISQAVTENFADSKTIEEFKDQVKK